MRIITAASSSPKGPATLSEHQQHRLDTQPDFDCWTEARKKPPPFELGIWSRPVSVDVWNGCVNYEWQLFGRLRIHLHLPIRNWIPPTDEQYEARAAASRKLSMIPPKGAEGYEEIELAEERKQAEAELDRVLAEVVEGYEDIELHPGDLEKAEAELDRMLKAAEAACRQGL